MKLLVDLPDVQFTVGRPLRTSSQSVSRVLCCANGYDKHRKREQRCRSVGKYCKRTASTRQVQYIHAVLRNGLSNAERDEIINCNVAKLVQIPAPLYKIDKGLPVSDVKRILVEAQRSHYPRSHDES